MRLWPNTSLAGNKIELNKKKWHCLSVVQTEVDPNASSDFHLSGTKDVLII